MGWGWHSALVLCPLIRFPSCVAATDSCQAATLLLLRAPTRLFSQCLWSLELWPLQSTSGSFEHNGSSCHCNRSQFWKSRLHLPKVSVQPVCACHPLALLPSNWCLSIIFCLFFSSISRSSLVQTFSFLLTKHLRLLECDQRVGALSRTASGASLSTV